MFRITRDPAPHAAADRPEGIWADALGRTGIRAGQFILILVLAVGIVYAGIQLKLVVIPVLLALILAAAVSPLVAWLSRRMPRALATVISLLAGVLVLGGAITGIVLSVESQWQMLSDSVTSGIDAVVDFVNNGPIKIDPQQIEDAQTAVTDFLTSSAFGSGALAGVSAAVEVVTGFVLGAFLLFYFTKDGPTIWTFLLKPLKPVAHAKARRAGGDAVVTLGGYVRGTAIVAFVDAFFIGAGLLILQVPLALPLAVLVFIGAFIPIVGATATGIIAALVALVTVDLQAAIIVTIIVVAVNQLEGNFLSPVVLGNAIKLHPLVVLVALTAGTILGGIVGTLLSVPVAAVAWAIIKKWRHPVVPVAGVDFPKALRQD